ncbi:MAG TPA: hypothetical protein PK737_00275 [Bacilli bacterium]|nr:hypothetical protein [Bacilli bacterium]
MFGGRKKFQLTDLYIGVVANVSVAYLQSKNYLTATKTDDHRMILRLDDETNNNEKVYEEIFTGTLYDVYNSEYSNNGDLVVWQVEPILPYCTNEELLKNKISLLRLIEISNIVNNKDQNAVLKLVKTREANVEK